MKIKNNLLLLILLLAIFANGQESKKYQKFKKKKNYKEGYVILNSDTTISHGLIKLDYSNGNLFFSLLKFVNKNGVAFEFVPMEVTEFGFNNKKFISNDIDFLEFVSEGNKIQLYKMMYEDYTDLKMKSSHLSTGAHSADLPPTYFDISLKSVTKKYMIRKIGEEKLIEVNKRNFKDVFNEQFKDCETIMKRLNTEKIKFKDVENIVKEYNFCSKP